jgi:VWFA-related protein
MRKRVGVAAGLRALRRIGVAAGLGAGVAAGLQALRSLGTCLALLSLAAGALAVSAFQQPSSTPQRPTFRAAANFVQVDVYPAANGKPIADLSKDEFEVLEDGVPQAVATFEHVSIRPASPGTVPVEPRSTADEKDMVADPHNRLFVLFLDTYHVTDPTGWHNADIRMPGSTAGGRPRENKPLGPRGIDKAIVTFLERAIGPSDLVAAMSPEMDANQMVFGRRPERFADWVNTAWARRFAWDDLSPEEESWALCYPPDVAGDPFGCYRGIFEEMVLRSHEARTLQALADTVTRLGTLREGRKALLLVSEGWPMYRPNQQLARAVPLVSTQGCPPEPPPVPGIYVGPGGKLQGGSDPRNPQNVDRSTCNAARLRLALVDNESDYRRLLDRANREMVSFYPIDPRGLAVFDTPIDATSPTGARFGQNDMNQLRSRLETLRNLASATDGFVSESNDFDASMKRVADDLADYYLLGYNSTNAKLDGKFRKITVRVKRPGVQVRARRGYLAATEAEMRARTPDEAPVDPALRLRESALASLGTMPADLPLRVVGGFDWTSGQAATLWAVAELGESAAKLPEWREGGEAQVTVTATDGSVVASAKGALSSTARAFAWRAGTEPLEPGDYMVRVSARPSAAGTAGVGGQVRVTVPGPAAFASGQPATPRLLRRGPSTGLAFVPTADTKFRRVERIRLEVSLGRDLSAASGRLLDRRGLVLAVPVAASVRDEGGQRTAVAEAMLASLAPGDYLVELTLGDGASRQVVLAAIRIVP